METGALLLMSSYVRAEIQMVQRFHGLWPECDNHNRLLCLRRDLPRRSRLRNRIAHVGWLDDPQFPISSFQTEREKSSRFNIGRRRIHVARVVWSFSMRSLILIRVGKPGHQRKCFQSLRTSIWMVITHACYFRILLLIKRFKYLHYTLQYIGRFIFNWWCRLFWVKR